MADTIHIDKLLTNFATRYRVNDDVADFVAPPFKVKHNSDKYTEYGKESLRLYDNKLSGRQEAREIDVDISTSTYATEEYSLAKFVSARKRSNTDRPINMDQDAVRKLKDAQMIAREKRVADIAGDNTIITQTADAAGDWDTITSGTPIADIRTGMKTIWTAQAGSVKANAITIPVDVAILMIGTDEYRDYFKYSGLASNEQFNIVSGLRHLGLQPMMAGVHGGNTNEGGASDPGAEAIWDDSVVIFHRQPSPTLETRTFMYSPYVKKDVIRRIEEKKQRGTTFDIYEDIDELLVDASAAYLITNTLTA
jgi:hypothetical protein